ncbi:MAG: flagellar hook-length control protein FliK [Defluviitaleaceae bacterium]|nr:flagellar hook-length control protein FliK [Defluviitaleaceae bacterium]
MKITDAFTGVGAVAANQNQVQNSQNGFDLLFADASRRHTIEITTDTQNRNENRGRSRSEESRANPANRPERTSRRENSSPNTEAAAEATTETAVTQDTAPVAQYEPAPDEAEINEEQAAESIAAIMQMPVEVVIELMGEQGITAKDLLDVKAVSKFLQEVLDVESPTALLTDPEFPEKYKAINEAMAGLLQEAEAELTLTAQTTEAGAKAAQQAQKGVAYTAAPEGLEVLNENGQLIVTDETATEEVYANTTRAASSREASSATTEQQPQTGGHVQEGPTSNLLVSDEVIPDDQQAIDLVPGADMAKAKDVQAARLATPTQPVNTTDVIEQIMSQVKVTQAGGQFTEMRMTLRPESLGDIVLRVLTQNGIVIAQFEAESQRVKEALEADFNQLRDALEEQGIQFSELSVSVRQDENERLNQFERERQRSRQRMETIEEVPEEEITSYHNGVIDITA